MCFAPQQHALFRHRNFQKWSEPGVFCTFWLGNVLCPTEACNFSSLIWPAGSAPAALASLLFDPPEPQIIGKTQCFATFLPFRVPGSSFFWDFLFFDLVSSSLLYSSLLFLFLFLFLFSSLLFSSLTLTTSAFHLSILSEVWLLNFLRSSYHYRNIKSSNSGGWFATARSPTSWKPIKRCTWESLATFWCGNWRTGWEEWVGNAGSSG